MYTETYYSAQAKKDIPKLETDFGLILIIFIDRSF